MVSIWDAFACWLSKRVLKKRFLESGLSKIVNVSNLENTFAMSIILFFKTFKIWFRIQKGNKKLRERDFGFWYKGYLPSAGRQGYLRSAVNVLTSTPTTSPNTRGDIFQINFPEDDGKHDKRLLMEIREVFGTLSHIDCQCVFWNGAIKMVV